MILIWVEGPSDRIYINRWIELFSEGKLEEGRDHQCGTVSINPIKKRFIAHNVHFILSLLKNSSLPKNLSLHVLNRLVRSPQSAPYVQ